MCCSPRCSPRQRPCCCPSSTSTSSSGGVPGPPGPPGPQGPSEVVLGQTLFVDSTNGDDSTAARGRQDLPYRTIKAAVAAAEGQDHVLLLPGNHYVTQSIPLPLALRLTIGGMGDAADTTVDLTANVTMFTMYENSPQSITFERFQVTTPGATFLDVDSDGSDGWFLAQGGGLTLRDLVLVGCNLQVVGAQQVALDHVYCNGITTLSECGFVDVDRCRFIGTYSLINTDASYVGEYGRGYKTHRSSLFASVTLRGAPLVFFDEACGIEEHLMVTANSYTNLGDLALRFKGVVGQGTSLYERSPHLTDFDDNANVRVEVVFNSGDGSLNALLGNAENDFSGVDFSGARITGLTYLRWQLPVTAPMPTWLVIGGIDTQWGDVTIESTNTATAANRRLFTLRRGTFKRRGRTSTVRCDHADVDLRGALLDNVTLTDTHTVTGAFAGFDRDQVNIAATALIANTSPPIPITPPFPPYAAGNYQVTVTPVGGTTALIGINLEAYNQFNYVASASATAKFQVRRNSQN